MDLNLDHYSLEDLLKLFKLPEQFTEADLKEARKRVVAVHPDKSGLDKEYFIFFHKAYSLLSSVHSSPELLIDDYSFVCSKYFELPALFD
jgi:hypothetical protein